MKTIKPTELEKRRMAALKSLPCICCYQDGHTQPNPTEVDHSVENGYRSNSGGHSATIPLCGWHHRGIVYSSPARGSMTSKEMLAAFGPSMRLHHKAFRAKYGSDGKLRQEVDQLLEKRAVALRRQARDENDVDF